jgi:hypothetical protein
MLGMINPLTAMVPGWLWLNEELTMVQLLKLGRRGFRRGNGAHFCTRMAHPARFELTTSAFGGQRSIQLSYGCRPESGAEPGGTGAN